jgi:hypothetical protein
MIWLHLNILIFPGKLEMVLGSVKQALKTASENPSGILIVI